DGSVSAGANEVTSVSLFTDKPEELKNKAREDAVNQAKEKAKSASKIAGFRLGHLIGFNENFSGEPRMFYEKMGMGGGTSNVAPSPQIEPGSQDITVSVTLTYLIK
ncbi:MAG: SIMPL domain-containing protein, partial [Parcubacteria group bacterium]